MPWTLPQHHRARIIQLAHYEVTRALMEGRLIRPPACEACGATEYTPNAHHDDYREPVEVRWLCPGCHKRHHLTYGPGLGLDELVAMLSASDV